jgi:hypothetical protein
MQLNHFLKYLHVIIFNHLSRGLHLTLKINSIF